MDAGLGFVISSEKNRIESHHPLRNVGSGPYLPPLHSFNRTSTRTYGDRFIPNRAAMDMNVAHYLLTAPKREKENNGPVSPSKEAYRKALADILLGGRTRIFSFRNRPHSPIKSPDPISTSQAVPAKKRRYIPHSADRTLDAPDIVDDYYLNLLDWGNDNVLSIALHNTVYLWNGNNGSTSELVTIGEDSGPVTSVSWAPDGRHLAVGLNSSHVQLWDVNTNKLMRTLSGIHSSRVGCLAWKNHLLTTGSMDSSIVNNDTRVPAHSISSFRAHTGEVCGLKWSNCGQHLASGGNDSRLYIWNLSSSTPVHRFRDHTAAVKALAWCPYQSKLLASGGGGSDRCIKFWNVNTGVCLNSVDTGSQVCALLWNKKEKELLSSHGLMDNQLTLWKYPSMTKMAELHGHTKRVLFMAQSPDGCTVASAAGDETLRFWNVFGVPEARKPAAPKIVNIVGPTNRYSFIR